MSPISRRRDAQLPRGELMSSPRIHALLPSIYCGATAPGRIHHRRPPSLHSALDEKSLGSSNDELLPRRWRGEQRLRPAVPAPVGGTVAPHGG
jgi:hypothetical protein